MRLWLLSSGNGNCESILRKLAAPGRFYEAASSKTASRRGSMREGATASTRRLETSRDGL